MSAGDSLIPRLCTFLDASPTPFHAVASVKAQLTAAGYAELREDDAWHLEPEGRYFVTRNDSALIAFRSPGRFPEGPTLIGAHTDSPALKLKPKPELEGAGTRAPCRGALRRRAPEPLV